MYIFNLQLFMTIQLSSIYLTILSCVNNPYHIGDQTHFIGIAGIQFYIGRIVTLNTLCVLNCPILKMVLTAVVQRLI